MTAAFVAALFAASPAPAAAARWVRAESEHFILYSDGDEAVVRAYADKLERYDAMLRERHYIAKSGAAPRKLPVYLVADTAGLRKLIPGASEILRGIYIPTTDDIFAAAIRSRDEDNTLLHEYAHHFMYQNFPYAFPRWVVEGYAEYYAPTKIKGKAVDFGISNQGRVEELVYGKWNDWRQVLSGAEMKTGESVSMFYAQSWFLTHYFLSDEGRRAKFGAYLSAVGNGADPVAAIEPAIGAPVGDLERMMRSYLQSSGVGAFRFTSSFNPQPVVVTPMPASAGDMLLLGQRVKRGAAKDARAALLAEVRAAAARHPGDRLAEVTLARAEIEFGDLAVADAILARWTAALPDDVEIAQLSAMSRMAAGDKVEDSQQKAALYKEAQRHVARAFKVKADDHLTLYLYFRARAQERGFPSDNDVEALLAAQEMAPQLHNLRVEAAQMLTYRKNYDYALHLLAPLANDPHDASFAAWVREQMEDIREQKAKGANKEPK